MIRISIYLLAVLLAFSGCSKRYNTSENLSNDPLIDAMVTDAMNELGNQEVYAGLPETGLFMDNDGIPSVFLAEEQDLDGQDSLRGKIRMHSLIRCLKTINLGEAQPEQVRNVLHDYKVCTESAVKRAKAIYHKLQASYKEKYHALYRDYQAGIITEREFKKRVEELRVAFKRELHALQLEEKLDQALAKCFRSLLHELKSILDEGQWLAFTDCYLTK